MYDPQDLVDLIFKVEELKVFNKLKRLGYIIGDSTEVIGITESGYKFLTGVKERTNVGWITTEYRKRFKDCNPLKFGTKAVVEKKVLEVMNEMEASKEEVLQAVDLYIQNLEGDYSNSKMASADYFASFTDKEGNRLSKLSQMIEIIREEPTSDHSWT